MLGVVAVWVAACPLQAQEFTQEQQDAVQRVVASKLPEHMGVGSLKVRSLTVENDTVKVDVSENFGDVPFTQDGVEQMRGEIRESLGAEFSDYPVLIPLPEMTSTTISLTMSRPTSAATSHSSANLTPIAITSTAWTATSWRCGQATAGTSSPSSTAGSGNVPA